MTNILPITSILETPERHEAFVTSVIRASEDHIHSLDAVRGFLIRNAYAVIRAVRPGYVHFLVQVLSRDYIAEFGPMHEAFRKSQELPSAEPKPFLSYVSAHRAEADAIFWKVADAYAVKYKRSIVTTTYRAMRSSIQAHLSIVFQIICAEIDRSTFVEA